MKKQLPLQTVYLSKKIRDYEENEDCNTFHVFYINF